MQRFLRLLIPIATLCAAGLLVWSQVSTRRANTLADEANAEIEAYVVTYNQAGSNFQLLFNDANEQAFPQNRTILEPLARDTVALYEKSLTHARTAADKFDSAAKLPSSEPIMRYHRARCEQFTMHAERCELLKEYTLLWIDPQLQSSAALTAKQSEINARLAPIEKAEKGLEEQGNQILAAHSSKFE